MKKENLWKKLEEAEKGRLFWDSLEAENGHLETLYLLFCGEDEVLERLALVHLTSLLKARKAEKAVILSHEKKEALKGFDLGDKAEIRLISQEEAEQILCFYELYQFTERLFVLSYDRPFGNKLIHLREKGYDPEQILKDCLFRLKDG